MALTAGEVTGYSYLFGDVETHAFLYSGGTMIDLNTLTPERATGWECNQRCRANYRVDDNINGG